MAHPKENLIDAPRQEIELVVLGGSAGSLEPLHFILANLPRGFCVPMIIVVHRSNDETGHLLNFMKKEIQVPVKEAEDQEPMRPGWVYLAPAHGHLLISKHGKLSLSEAKPFGHARPSIDVLFNSAANHFGSRVLGILLSGGNQDGSLGLKKIRNRGGIGIVQNPSLAKINYMPQSALNMAGADWVLNVEQIVMFLDETHSFMNKKNFKNTQSGRRPHGEY